MKTTNYSTPISYSKKENSSDQLLLINTKYKGFLQKVGLDSFANIWSLKKGELIKRKKERSVFKVQFPLKDDPDKKQSQPEETDAVFYIKKHRQKISLFQRLIYLFSSNQAHADGLKEFYHYCNFRNNGLGTAIPVAAGMKWSSFFHVDSFLITEDYKPFVDLEHFILNISSILQGTENQEKRNNILREIALYARRMHNSNMNHKDFNATHILLHDIESDRPEVALFDLQHVNTNRFSKFRWPIKALAELSFSLPSFIFNDKDKIFLFENYKNSANLSLLDRLQYYWITKKTERIARHSDKRGLAPKAHSSN
jgi:hypothetical protein